MGREIKNAIIESTSLGKEGHGILSCMIHLNYGGAGQGFGGHGFDEWDASQKKRIGCAYGMRYLARILEVLEVDTWEKLPGTHLRADAEWGKIHGIGNILKDLWFYPDKEKDVLISGKV